MNNRLIFLLVLASTPLIVFMVQIAISRILKKLDIAPQTAAFVSILTGAGIISAAALYLGIFQPSKFIIRQLSLFVYIMIVYGALAISYFHVFNMSETARRIRMLYEILSRGTVSKETLRSIYGKEHMVSRRLERLAKIGQVHYINGRYALKSHLLYYVTRVVIFWRGVLGFGPEKDQ